VRARGQYKRARRADVSRGLAGLDALATEIARGKRERGRSTR
jgi:hypothetical protein